MIIDFAPAAVQSDPADIDPTDHAPGIDPTADDAAWWSANCDHEGGCHPDALSPDEEDLELDWREMNERARDAMEADWLARYAVC